MRNFHKASLLGLLRDKWRRDGKKSEEQGWTCGFCGVGLGTWDKRETHIAGHFKDGRTMAEWRDPEQGQAQMAQTEPVRQEQDVHSTMLSRLQRRFTHQQHTPFASQPPSDFSNTFEAIPSSSRCVSIAPAPVLPEIADMGFGGYMPGFMGGGFDVSGASGFGGTYAVDNGAYGGAGAGVYQGAEGMHMGFDASNGDLYGGLGGGYNDVWGQGQR